MPRKMVPCAAGCGKQVRNAANASATRCRACYNAAVNPDTQVKTLADLIGAIPDTLRIGVPDRIEPTEMQPIRVEIGAGFRPIAKADLPTKAPRILVIPDTQIKPGVDIEHLKWAGRYAAAKRPDAIVLIGDWWDMPSLSSYDRGKKGFEGRRYRADIEAGLRGLELFMNPIRQTVTYNPYIPFTEGNHEYRVTRTVEETAVLDGVIGPQDFHLDDFGIEYHPFLETVEIHGVEFSHYFTSGVMGRPVSSAAALVRERMKSAVMGHVQYTDLHFHKKTRHFGLFAGRFYTHDEEYLGQQDNNQRCQIVMLNEVRDGTADPMFLSIDYLKRRFS